MILIYVLLSVVSQLSAATLEVRGSPQDLVEVQTTFHPFDIGKMSTKRACGNKP